MRGTPFRPIEVSLSRWYRAAEPMDRTVVKIEALFGTPDRVSKIAAIVGLVVLAAHWGLVFAFIVPRLGTLGFVRLHHTATLGVDWIGEWWKLFVFPIAGCAAFFVNALLSGILTRRTVRAAPVIHVTTACLQVLLATAGVIALLLNG